MTRTEYDTLAKWFLAGTAEVNCLGAWAKMVCLPDFNTLAWHEFGDYRERPQPTLPSEVWLSDMEREVRGFREAFSVKSDCLRSFGGSPIRYIRADGVIDGARLQWRPTFPDGSRGEWRNLNASEYRFRP